MTSGNTCNVADELCVYRGCQAESINHPTVIIMNTGNRFGGDPAIGSWVTYGLGSENQNLPGYVVLPEVAYPKGEQLTGQMDIYPLIFKEQLCVPRALQFLIFILPKE